MEKQRRWGPFWKEMKGKVDFGKENFSLTCGCLLESRGSTVLTVSPPTRQVDVQAAHDFLHSALYKAADFYKKLKIILKKV